MIDCRTFALIGRSENNEIFWVQCAKNRMVTVEKNKTKGCREIKDGQPRRLQWRDEKPASIYKHRLEDFVMLNLDLETTEARPWQYVDVVAKFRLQSSQAWTEVRPARFVTSTSLCSNEIARTLNRSSFIRDHCS